MQSCWDCFAVEGIHRVILGCEFAINSGDATHVCCKKPYYEPNETKDISKHIQVLEGTMGFSIVKGAGDHQLSLRQNLTKSLSMILTTLCGECVFPTGA